MTTISPKFVFYDHKTRGRRSMDAQDGKLNAPTCPAMAHIDRGTLQPRLTNCTSCVH